VCHTRGTAIIEEHLRPIERRVLQMHETGVATDQIAARLKRSPAHIERMIEWTDIPRTRRPDKYTRALEARVLSMRAGGMDHTEIGERFGRSARNIRQIEAFAHYRRAMDLLTT